MVPHDSKSDLRLQGITLCIFEQIRDFVSSECTWSKRSSAVAASDSSTVRAPRNFLAKVTHTY